MTNLHARISILVLLLFTTATANAALLSRLGGQAWYDTVLDVTWLADANFARSSGFDGDGLMTWAQAQDWIASLNGASHLGANDWRLPFVVDTGEPGCDWAYAGTDCGYNVQTMSGGTVYSEMAHLFFVTLGNFAFCSPTGLCPQPTGGIGTGLSNPGPFANFQPDSYWSGTTYVLDAAEAWSFAFDFGYQDSYDKIDYEHYALAVRAGDIALVPVPAVGWLLAGCLALLGARATKRGTTAARSRAAPAAG